MECLAQEGTFIYSLLYDTLYCWINCYWLPDDENLSVSSSKQLMTSRTKLLFANSCSCNIWHSLKKVLHSICLSICLWMQNWTFPVSSIGDYKLYKKLLIAMDACKWRFFIIHHSSSSIIIDYFNSWILFYWPWISSEKLLDDAQLQLIYFELEF